MGDQKQKEMLIEGLLSGQHERAASKAYHSDPVFKMQIDMLAEMMSLSATAMLAEVPVRSNYQRNVERILAWVPDPQWGPSKKE